MKTGNIAKHEQPTVNTSKYPTYDYDDWPPYYKSPTVEENRKAAYELSLENGKKRGLIKNATVRIKLTQKLGEIVYIADNYQIAYKQSNFCDPFLVKFVDDNGKPSTRYYADYQLEVI